MNKTKAQSIYKECINMNLSQMQDIIASANTSEEQAFYVALYNYVLQSRQRKVVADGKF